jgi:hypothetical protein
MFRSIYIYIGVHLVVDELAVLTALHGVVVVLCVKWARVPFALYAACLVTEPGARGGARRISPLAMEPINVYTYVLLGSGGLRMWVQ